jgi:hypothetical protein
MYLYSDNIALEDWVIEKEAVVAYPRIRLKALRNITKNLTQDSMCHR